MKRDGFERLEKALHSAALLVGAEDGDFLVSCSPKGSVEDVQTAGELSALLPIEADIRFLRIATTGGRVVAMELIPNVLAREGLMNPATDSDPNLRLVAYRRGATLLMEDDEHDYLFEDINANPTA